MTNRITQARAPWLLLLLAAPLLGAGCSDAPLSMGSAGGSGGQAGSAGSGTAGMGTAGASTGGSAGSGTASCAVDGDCVVPQYCAICSDGTSSCASARCESGKCVTITPTCGGTGGAGGGGNGGSGNGGSGGSSDCATLLQDVHAKLALAQACLPGETFAPQCQSVVAGECCDVVVDQAGSSASNDYLAALGRYQAACDYVCPAIACRLPTTGVCTATTPGASSGACQ